MAGEAPSWRWGARQDNDKGNGRGGPALATKAHRDNNRSGDVQGEGNCGGGNSGNGDNDNSNNDKYDDNDSGGKNSDDGGSNNGNNVNDDDDNGGNDGNGSGICDTTTAAGIDTVKSTIN